MHITRAPPWRELSIQKPKIHPNVLVGHRAIGHQGDEISSLGDRVLFAPATVIPYELLEGR